jgi:predicted acylesterase/phospholipase RssA
MTWSTFLARKDKSYDYRLVDVAEATSAAPTYFDHKTIDGKNYVDGGLFANDPMPRGVAHFAKYKPFDRYKDFVLSVGTGDMRDEVEQNPTLSGVELLNIVDVIFEANKNSERESSKELIYNYYKMDPEIRQEIYKLDVSDINILREFQYIGENYATSFIEGNPEFLDKIFQSEKGVVETFEPKNDNVEADTQTSGLSELPPTEDL